MACPDPIMTTMFSSWLLLTMHLLRISAAKTNAIQRYPRLSQVSTSSFTCQRCTKHTRLLIVIHPRKQKKTKNQCPKHQKEASPESFFIIYVTMSVVIVVLNHKMDCQISLTHLRSSPTPGMLWSFHPPKKNDPIKPVIGSLASLFCQKSSQHLGSHEYTLIWYIVEPYSCDLRPTK